MALTRGKAILQENRTVLLGNTVAVKPYQRASFAAVKKPAQLRTAYHGSFHPSSFTQMIPSLSQLAVVERSYANERKVYLAEDVDLSKINFGVPLKSRSSVKIIPIHYETDIKTLKLQTPIVRIPFGLSAKPDTKDQAVGRETYSVSLSFDNMDQNPDVKQFYDLINQFDEKILKGAEKYSKDWFDKEIPLPVLQHTFKRSIRAPKDASYSPTMKIKIPADTESGTAKPLINVFGSDKKPASYLDIVPNAKIVGILEPKYIWAISGTMIGVTWSLLQVKVMEKSESTKLSGYSFIEKPTPTK